MYYVRLRGKIMGPFPVEHLKALVERGQVAAFHELSSDGVSWMPAGSVAEVFPTPQLVAPVEPYTSDVQTPPAVIVTCPACGAENGVSQQQLGSRVQFQCHVCQEPFEISASGAQRHRVKTSRQQTPNRQQKHSGFGIASFLITLFVGGLDFILVIIASAVIAGSRSDWAFQTNFMAAVASLVYFNCASIPLCILGVGLAIVGLVAQPQHSHLFTRIGLWGNAIVIAVLVLFILAGSKGDAHLFHLF